MTVVVLPERSWFTIESAVMVEETLEPEQIMSRHPNHLDVSAEIHPKEQEPSSQHLEQDQTLPSNPDHVTSAVT
jgi:hypothetical protein